MSGETLLVLETRSITSGYRALDAITQNSRIRILEASPAGDRNFLILATGNDSAIKAAYDNAHEKLDGSGTQELIDHEIIPNIDQKVLDATYSLSSAQLSEALIVVDCDTVSGCLAIASSLIHSHKLEGIEIRIRRTGRGGAYGFFTGSIAECAPSAEEVRTRLRTTMREGSVELIENPTESFRAFFDPTQIKA